MQYVPCLTDLAHLDNGTAKVSILDNEIVMLYMGNINRKNIASFIDTLKCNNKDSDYNEFKEKYSL